ncbi:unnamed protein product [Blepharisma stoltei]|uniref:USP domain-containing protein n=1 Tax=Blepharisma stoltei TaxID=1481888 RepID=A0AAU9IR94_9CILI|nr:unnamed protein product [Blepharisma stoltei]
MSTSNLRTVCYVIAAINNNSTYNNLSIQLYDQELHETITNAFRHQIRESNLKNFYNLLGKSLSDTFEAIFQRNLTWSRYITPKIESSRLPEVSTNLKDVLFVYKRSSKINAYIYEGEYKLISSFNEKKAFCLFNEQWYDCNSNRESLIKGSPDFTFPATLVYMRVKKLLIANNVEITSEQNRRVQQLAFEIKSNGIARRNTSEEPTSASRNFSSPPKPFSHEQNYKDLNTASEVAERRYNKEDVERGNIFRDRETRKTDGSDFKIDQIMKIFNERYLEIETRLTKNFETKLQKSLEKHKYEESLKYQQVNKIKEELLNSAVNYDQMQQEKMMNIKNELINLEKKHFGLLQILSKALNSLVSKLKDKVSRNLNPSINSEKLKEEVQNEIYKITEDKFSDLNKEVSNLKAKYEKLYNEIKNKDYSIQDINNKLKDIDRKIINLPNKEEIETKMTSLQNKINSWKDERGSSLKDWESLKAQINFLEESISDNKNEISNASNKIKELEIKTNRLYPGYSIEISDHQNEQNIHPIADQSKTISPKLPEMKNYLKNNLDNAHDNYKQSESQTMKTYSPESQTHISNSRNVSSMELSLVNQSKSLPHASIKEPSGYQQIKNERAYPSFQQSIKKNIISRSSAFSKSGLPNIGNTCYMNSLIQIFASATEFVEYIKTFSSDKLFLSLSQIIELMQSNSDDYFIGPHIIELKNILSEEYSMFIGSSENDAKELFAIISDKVENRDLFTIVKNQSFTCKLFQHKEYNEDCSNFIIIPVNKQNDIENYFKEIKELKIYSGENQLNCTNCGKLRETIMKTESIQWPKILAIYMPNYQSSSKIPDSLRIDYNNLYSIFGVICYYGNHFIAFTKNNQNEWEKYNDSLVSKMDPDWNRLYLAFYKKNRF